MFQGSSASYGETVGAADLSAQCTAQPLDVGVSVDCKFIYAAEELKDGDAYELTVLDPTSNAVLASISAVVTYAEDRPNGPGCPPLCLVGTLQQVPQDQ